MSENNEQPETEPVGSSDLLAAELVCGHLSKNLAIEYQLNADKWTRDQAKIHFNKRSALARVQTLLIDEAENLCG